MELRDVEADPAAVTVRVVFAPGEPLRTREVPDFAVAAMASFPGLRGHRCDNDAGLSFADELADTELAHVVEHVALELLAMAFPSGSPRGVTSWDFAADGRGVFRVRIESEDATAARRALESAATFVEVWRAGEPGPDPVAEAVRLRAAR